MHTIYHFFVHNKNSNLQFYILNFKLYLFISFSILWEKKSQTFKKYKCWPNVGLLAVAAVWQRNMLLNHIKKIYKKISDKKKIRSEKKFRGDRDICSACWRRSLGCPASRWCQHRSNLSRSFGWMMGLLALRAGFVALSPAAASHSLLAIYLHISAGDPEKKHKKFLIRILQNKREKSTYFRPGLDRVAGWKKSYNEQKKYSAECASREINPNNTTILYFFLILGIKRRENFSFLT